jgi:hypothetical protein
MRRRLLPILIVLVAGAVVNVAVAWGCTLLVGPGEFEWAEFSFAERWSGNTFQFEVRSFLPTTRDLAEVQNAFISDSLTHLVGPPSHSGARHPSHCKTLSSKLRSRDLLAVSPQASAVGCSETGVYPLTRHFPSAPFGPASPSIQ